MKRTLLAIAIGAISAGVAGGVLAEETENEDELNGDTETSEEQPDTDTQGLDDETEPTDSPIEDSPDKGDTDDLDSDQGELTTEEQTEEGAGQGETEDPETDAQTEEPPEEPTDTETEGDTEDMEEDTEEPADAEMEDDGEDMQEEAENPLDESLGSMQVSELEGMTVVNQEEEEIGDVKNIVKHDESGKLYAVITVGGFWGFGGDDIALPLQDMQLQDDQLLIESPYGEDEIKESAEDYDEDTFSEVEDDMTLSDAWG